MSGYYRFPTINNSTIVFVAEDDLWSVDINNPKAFRLTTNISEVSSPLISPDGKWIAYVGREDGNTEIYLMPSIGGISKRLTFVYKLKKKKKKKKKNNNPTYLVKRT